MEFKIHEEALEELKELPEQDREKIQEEIDSRKKRGNTILKQRGTGISYDNHGDPIHYFKVEDGIDYRVFFHIEDRKVVVLGIRERNDLTYLNLREYTNRK